MATHNLTADARKEAAAKGEAMPDGSYPIRDRAELAKAILAIGRATDPQAVKAHIIKRARALNVMSFYGLLHTSIGEPDPDNQDDAEEDQDQPQPDPPITTSNIAPTLLPPNIT